MVTPHNTGKVRIGCHYVPAARVSFDADAELIQAAVTGWRLTLTQRLINFFRRTK